MKLLRFILFTILLVAGCGANSFYSHVKKYAEFTLRELLYQRRHSGDGGMAGDVGTTAPPSRLTEFKTFTFTIDGNTIQLNLKLNPLQDDHVPVKVMKGNKAHLVRDDASRDYAFYQNVDEPDETKASVMVRCPDGEECHILGRFEYENETYFIEPCTHQPKKKGVKHGTHKVNINNVHDNMEDTEPITLSTITLNGTSKKNFPQQKRAAKNHVIELSMVIDYSVFQYMLAQKENDADLATATIKEYYEQVANNMDRIFESAATATMTIDIVPLEIIIMTDKESCPWVTSNLQTIDDVEYLGENALDSFNTWVLENKSVFGDYDAVMTFTRKELATISTNETTGQTKADDGLNGVALQYGNQDGLISAVCGDKENYISASIVQDFDSSDVSGVAAHELAHTMGVSHDYILGCKTGSQYVMAWYTDSSLITDDTVGNPWAFSSCSITALETYVTKLADSQGSSLCTQTNTYNEADYTRVQAGQYLGQIYTLDEQCGLMYGNSQSETCGVDTTTCSKGMWCWIPGTNSCTGMYAVMIGSTINDQKCYKGELVDTLP